MVDSACSWVPFINNSSYRLHERRHAEVVLDGAGERVSEKDREGAEAERKTPREDRPCEVDLEIKTRAVLHEN